MIDVLVVIFTILTVVVTGMSWRRILLPERHPDKIRPPLSTWLMFCLVISLSLATSFDTDKATLRGNIGIATDVLRAFGTVVALLYVKDFEIGKFDLVCIVLALAIGAFWWMSGAAQESNLMLQGVMVLAYFPTYRRLWHKSVDSVLLLVLAITTGALAWTIAHLDGEVPPQIYAGRAIVMVSVMLVLQLRILRIEHDCVPIGDPLLGYRVYRFFALRKEDPFYDEARAYVLYWIRNPDPGSWFDRMTWWYRNWLPLPLLFGLLRLSGRDCILIRDDSGVVAHVFWHRWLTRRHEIRMFNVEVREDCRGRGLMRQILIRHFGLYCYNLPGVYWVQLSAGGKRGKTARYDPEAVMYVYRKLVTADYRICKDAFVRAEPDFWFDFFLKRERAGYHGRFRSRKEVSMSR